MPDTESEQILQVSDKAASVFRESIESEGASGILLRVDAAFSTALEVVGADIDEAWQAVTVNDIVFYVPLESLPRVQGVAIDFHHRGAGGFVIDNPNAPPSLVEIEVQDLKARLDSGEFVQFFDVRTQAERDTAMISGTRLLDDATVTFIETLDRGTPLVFHCHHGFRSRSAAQYFLSKGFRKVYNMVGGIDAWSLSIDKFVPRY